MDLLLVIHFQMGVEGVAIATLCADVSSVVLGLFFVARYYRHEFPLLQHILPHWPTVREMMQVNRYIFVRTGTLLLTFAFFTAQGARLGEEFLAANAVLLTFLLLISNALDGFAHGAEALVGEACGQKNHAQVKRVIQVSLLWSAVSAGLLIVTFGVGGAWLISLLTDLESVRSLASGYLIWLVLMPLISVWCYTFDGIFIGSTKVRAMQNIMLVSTFGIFLPMIWAIEQLEKSSWIASSEEANHLLWLAMTLFMLSRSVGMALCSRHYSHKKSWF